MTRRRTKMLKIKEIIRLRREEGLLHRDIAQSCRVSAASVSRVLSRFALSGLPWPLDREYSDSELYEIFYKENKEKDTESKRTRVEPDWAKLAEELTRKGVTRKILWKEYIAANPGGYKRSQFNQLFAKYLKSKRVSMHLEHRPGEKCFVDYAGDTITIYDPEVGEHQEISLFIGTMGLSSIIYCEGVKNREQASWIGSHIRMFEFWGAVPHVLVPDNLRTGVTKANFYDPEINEVYHDFATHYGTVVIPARVRRPKDKAKVEEAVKYAAGQILARLRDMRFTSLGELNIAIAQILEDINGTPFQKKEGTRKSLFDQYDKPAMKPLPGERFQNFEVQVARVDSQYYVEVDGNYYSVPFKFVGKKVKVFKRERLVEVYYDGIRIAGHIRASGKEKRTLVMEHMPSNHRYIMEMTPERCFVKAKEIGDITEQYVRTVFSRKKHPEQALRFCEGLFKLQKYWSPAEIETACTEALKHELFKLKEIESILKYENHNTMNQKKSDGIKHLCDMENVRGPSYYN